MLTQFLYSLDIVPLLTAVLILPVQNFFGIQSIRTYFFTTRTGLILSMIFSAIFYDKSVFPQYIEHTAFTTALYNLTALLVLIWLMLAERWFKNKNISACRFCYLTLIILISLKIMLEAANLGIFAGALSLLLAMNYLFLCLSEDNDELHNTSLRYGFSALFFIIWLGAVLYFTYSGGWQYSQVAVFLNHSPALQRTFITGGIVLSFLFLLGAAPLHFWVTDIVASAILPVATYFSFIPLLILWGVFIKLHSGTFALQENISNTLYTVFGLLSILSAAVAAHISRNVRKIFAASRLYYTGIMLLAVSSLSADGYFAGLLYLFLFLPPTVGIYTTFYGFKSSGDYLYNLNMIGGFAKTHPYVGSSLVIFITALIGLAPFPLFVGLWLICDKMALQMSLFQIVIIFSGMILLVPAYLRIIQTICFGHKTNSFDRIEYGIHMLLGIILAVMAAVIVQPQVLITNVQLLLNVLTGVS